MKNEQTNAPLSNEDFNKGMDALEEEYELELKRLSAEIEQEKLQAEENKTDTAK